MRQLLFKYLVLYKKLAIPKVGSFNIEQLSAEVDQTNHLLFPPSQVVRFKANEPSADKHFFDFLVRETGLELLEVIKHIQFLSQQLLKDAQEKNGAILEGIGVLKKDENGHLLFFSEHPLDYLFPQVKVDKSISSTTVHGIEPTEYNIAELEGDELRDLLGQKSDELLEADNWWVYAIALILIGIGALLFYYI